MKEIEPTSDSIIFTTNQQLVACNISGFYVDRQGRRDIYSTERLRCILYDYIRGQVFFSLKTPNNMPRYQRYTLSEIEITKVYGESPAVLAAQKILRDAR